MEERKDSEGVGHQIEAGDALFLKGMFAEAVSSFSRSLVSNPENRKAYLNRALAYREMGRFEEYFADLAHYYESSPKNFDPTKSQRPGAIQQINKHFIEIALPSIKNSGEHFVESWYGYLEWDARPVKRLYHGYSSTALYGTAGYGYACLTDRNIYFLSFGNLAQKYAISKGGLRGVVNFLKWTSDLTEVGRDDKKILIPYSSISGVELSKDQFDEDRVEIHSPEMNVNFYSPEDRLLISAIQIGRRGKFTEIWNPSQDKSKSADEIFALISKLSDLQKSGAISEQDFETKKKELLSRL